MTTSPASSVSDALAQRVAANLIGVHRRIASTGREPSGVRIVAVTKTFDVAHVRVAAALGLSAVGENFVGELCAKRDAAMDVSVAWHYLGALQTNKIQRIVACADVICGVSRLKELERIADHQSDQAVYVQVDFTEAVGRNGAAPKDVEALVGRGRTLGLDVRGLMTVAPMDRQGARRAFGATRSLTDDLGLVECSMGMSDDLELACELGSSEVRVGRALFGPRGVDAAP